MAEEVEIPFAEWKEKTLKEIEDMHVELKAFEETKDVSEMQDHLDKLSTYLMRFPDMYADALSYARMKEGEYYEKNIGSNKIPPSILKQMAAAYAGPEKKMSDKVFMLGKSLRAVARNLITRVSYEKSLVDLTRFQH